MSSLNPRQAPTANNRYWRSVREQRGETLPSLPVITPDEPITATSRRNFLKVSAASLALASFQGCMRQPEEKILPYVEMPERLVPGKPLFFATAMPLAGYGTGLAVESHEGRPTKVEGNNLHPASLGATDIYAQASVLELYDPDRSQSIRNAGVIGSRQALVGALNERLASIRERKGRGLRILCQTVTSPTLAQQLERLSEQLPEFQWHQYEPVVPDTALAGAEAAFGRAVETRHHFDRADVVLSLGADFLCGTFWPVSAARHFMARRTVTGEGTPQMNRLYVGESTPTLTGAKADHRLPLSPAEIVDLARTVAADLGVEGVSAPSETNSSSSVPAEWIDAVCDDLENYRLADGNGGPLVVAGIEQPAEIHELAHRINNVLGAVGRTVTYLEPVHARPEPQLASLKSLCDAMQAGEVEVLLILGGNPAFDAPADFDFAARLKGVPLSLHSNLYFDETSALCDWHLPRQHYLESWSDVRAFDGTASVIQPLIAPLYDGWSDHEVLALLADESETSAYEIVRSHWRERLGDAGFEAAWEDALRRGVLPQTEAREIEVTLQQSGGNAFAANVADEFTVLFRPDPTIWDGRFANIGWLQELPKPWTKMTWDNAALISPAAAERLGVVNGDMVEVTANDRAVELPVWIMPGQAANCVTLNFGYGRTRAGRVGNGAGFDVYPLRTSGAPWTLAGARLRKTGAKYELVTTQEHHRMAGRHPVQSGPLDQFLEHPEHPPFMQEAHHPADASLLPEWPYDSYKWGMTIDLTACTGCSACIVACQAENNIPVVGKDEVARGREMHWIRVDAYYEGELENPHVLQQPVPCMHCEKAPCELVCPVAATTHSGEGLNEMTYNRCVGTRYCANNCPYKVRRFNFFQFADYDTPVLKLLRNPDVTVRSRGVMEKCTYCVQRINAARLDSQKEDRPIRAGEIETACQAVCPSQAIQFGDLNNQQEEVARLRQHPLNYSLLAELNTQPRTTYLAAVTNPNPKLAAASARSEQH